jgi:hypothetical protein
MQSATPAATIERLDMHPHNDPTSAASDHDVNDGFKRKDGLFEYGKNLLAPAERSGALERLGRELPGVSKDVRAFMRMPPDSEADGQTPEA